MIEIYTDGACSQNSSWKGGWGMAVIENDSLKYFSSGSEESTTNNRMELMAFLEGLNYLKTNNYKGNIFTDSAYISNCLNQKWYVKWRTNGWLTSKKEPVLNQDLWVDIIKLYELIEPKVIKVKGHSNNKWNNFVDKLAVEGRK